jgi:hypothetical protein
LNQTVSDRVSLDLLSKVVINYFLDFIVGRGSPLALQVRVVFVPMSAPVFNGGPVILGAAVNINGKALVE